MGIDVPGGKEKRPARSMIAVLATVLTFISWLMFDLCHAFNTPVVSWSAPGRSLALFLAGTSFLCAIASVPGRTSRTRACLMAFMAAICGMEIIDLTWGDQRLIDQVLSPAVQLAGMALIAWLFVFAFILLIRALTTLTSSRPLPRPPLRGIRPRSPAGSVPPGPTQGA
jgi:hypothetical protein